MARDTMMALTQLCMGETTTVIERLNRTRTKSEGGAFEVFVDGILSEDVRGIITRCRNTVNRVHRRRRMPGLYTTVRIDAVMDMCAELLASADRLEKLL